MVNFDLRPGCSFQPVRSLPLKMGRVARGLTLTLRRFSFLSGGTRISMLVRLRPAFLAVGGLICSMGIPNNATTECELPSDLMSQKPSFQSSEKLGSAY